MEHEPVRMKKDLVCGTDNLHEAVRGRVGNHRIEA